MRLFSICRHGAPDWPSSAVGGGDGNGNDRALGVTQNVCLDYCLWSTLELLGLWLD